MPDEYAMRDQPRRVNGINYQALIRLQTENGFRFHFHFLVSVTCAKTNLRLYRFDWIVKN